MKIQEPHKGITCGDGFNISIQASSNHYCSPRKDGYDVLYTQVELGFPSERDNLIDEYEEDLSQDGKDINWTGSVYGWVPSDIVALVIAKHGGMVSGQIPKLGYINRIPIMKGNSNEV